MPLFRIDNRLQYYAHVPKAGGSSVDHYLAARFGPLGFFNSQFGQAGQAQWTRTSPQHIRWRDLYRLVPREWIENSFAVVRDPLARLKSAYHFQKEALKTIPEDRSFDDWFRLRLPGLKAGSYFDDNHLLPQTRIVPPDATVFRLEDGLDPIVRYLDTIEGAVNGPRVIAPQNARTKKSGKPAPEAKVDARLIAQIEEIYAEDYQRFGYAPNFRQTTIMKPAQPPTSESVR